MESIRPDFAADMRLEGLFHQANIDLTIGKTNDGSTQGLVRRNNIVNKDLESGGFGQGVSRFHVNGQSSSKVPCQVQGSEGTRKLRRNIDLVRVLCRQGMRSRTNTWATESVMHQCCANQGDDQSASSSGKKVCCAIKVL